MCSSAEVCLVSTTRNVLILRRIVLTALSETGKNRMAEIQMKELLEKIDELIKKIAEKDAIIEKLTHKIELLTVAANENTTRTIYEKRYNPSNNKETTDYTHKRAHDEVLSQQTDENNSTQASLEAKTKSTSKKARGKARKLAEMEKRKVTHNEQANEEDDILSQNRFANLSTDFKITDNNTLNNSGPNPHSDKHAYQPEILK